MVGSTGNLGIVASGCGEKIALHYGFHPLGNYLEPQFVPHDDDRFAKDQIAGVSAEVVNE
jgi:hypothetical protein